jgi:A/G-specific adenine glycosylase
MAHRYFSEKVVEWYIDHKRDLPWRNTVDPYKIWLSEIILQQTRVSQGLPYYLRFIEKFPDVYLLAAASEQEILRIWQGLGYYSRARNLHKCAKEVVTRLNGQFPTSFSELLKLPGIGDYTAAAIASFSAQEVVPVVDGNVYRVLSRVFGEHTEINSPAGKKLFFALASKLIHQTRPDEFNQGIMEFGATWCTPRLPKCDDCVLSPMCVARAQNLQQVLPVKKKSKKSRKRYFYYFVFRKGKSLLMKKRSAGDIWQGLFDFYLVEKSKPVRTEVILRELTCTKKPVQTKQLQTSTEYKHVLSHQTIISKFTVLDDFTIPPSVAEEDLQYYSIKKIHDLPKPVLISRFLEDYDFL